jgi:hypothetical protein
VALGSIEVEERLGSELAMRDESSGGRKLRPRKRSRARTPRPRRVGSSRTTAGAL